MNDPRLLSDEALAIYPKFDEPTPWQVACLLNHIDALTEENERSSKALANGKQADQ